MTMPLKIKHIDICICKIKMNNENAIQNQMHGYLYLYDQNI